MNPPPTSAPWGILFPDIKLRGFCLFHFSSYALGKLLKGPQMNRMLKVTSPDWLKVEGAVWRQWRYFSRILSSLGPFNPTFPRHPLPPSMLRTFFYSASLSLYNSPGTAFWFDAFSSVLHAHSLLLGKWLQWKGAWVVLHTGWVLLGLTFALISFEIPNLDGYHPQFQAHALC